MPNACLRVGLPLRRRWILSRNDMLFIMRFTLRCGFGNSGLVDVDVDVGDTACSAVGKNDVLCGVTMT
jgi:hypothetical protein